MKWNIVCDSSGELPPAQLIPGKLDRKVVPLTLLVGDRSYVDDETLDDPSCFQRIERIVTVYEALGAGGGSRHDF